MFEKASRKFSRFLSNDLSLLGGIAADESLAGRVRAAQIDAIVRYTPWMMLASTLNALILAVAFANTPQRVEVNIWAVLVGVLAALVYRKHRASRGKPHPSASVIAVYRSVRNAFVFGSLWAIVPLFFFPNEPGFGQLVVCCICAGMLCGGGFALSTVPAAAIAFTSSIWFGSAWAFLRTGEPIYSLVLLLLCIYTYVIIRSAIAHALLFADSVIARERGEQQRDLIGLLLCEFEENASDWLWETDENLRIRHISARLAEMLGEEPGALAGRHYAEALLPGARLLGDQSGARETFVNHMESGTPFADVVVGVIVKRDVRFWSFKARPVFDETMAFSGFRGVGTDVTEARVAEMKIRHLAHHDALTNLPNRIVFQDELLSACADLASAQRGFAAFLMDLDNFKVVNDTFGHAAGDQLLKQAALRFRACIGPDDIVARLSGDEFAIIQRGAQSEEASARLASSLIEAMKAPFQLASCIARCGVSIGIALAPRDGSECDSLLTHADLALYVSKAGGRGGYSFFSPEMDADAREKRHLEADLRLALANDEFRLDYQPLMSLSDDRISGCEALLRWDHPKRGLVPPLDFIPLAEDTGLIVQIGAWVIRQACRDAAAWPGDLRVAVNVSAVQLRGPGIVATIAKALAETGLAASRLEVEITESVLISESETALAILDTLHRMGVRIALDDFGTGYSSLAYLRKLPFDKIKIDRSFVHDYLEHLDCAAIVDSLIGLAQQLGMGITAEGVETEAQLKGLRAKGCPEAQGFLICRPMGSAEFMRLVEHGRGAETRAA